MADKNSFKVSAELLQKNAAKASIRDLNAEFQRMGGKVIHKTSKKGPVFQLSHYDEEYLEQFRIRLLRELGVLEESKIPEELKKKVAPPPRYGDQHRLRRGWNVRSDRERKEGITDDRYRKPTTPHPSSAEGKGDSAASEVKEGKSGPEEEKAVDVREKVDLTPVKSFEERWGNIDEYMKIVEGALGKGAVDDGDIIRYAYSTDTPDDRIRKLKKILWDNRCSGPKETCPYKRKKFRFEDLMKVRMGEMEGLDRIDSPFLGFYESWKKNVDNMYEPFRDRKVEVEGKVSSTKAVRRKGGEHLKMLVYDTLVKETGSSGDPVSTRKFWVKIPLDDFEDLTGEEKLRLGDIIHFEGKCIFDPYFNDYWIVDLERISVLKKGDGETILV